MKLTTKKGHGFFEVTSAFQKAIRRNEEATALYFMVELFNSGYDEYAWKRIKIMASEDIGLAEPTMPATIQALYQSYTELKKDNKENKPERMFLTHAVLLLCRAKKSRLVDYALIKIWREHDSLTLPIPDYAYDMHNTRGKQMGRGIDHFYNDGTVLANHNPQPGEEQMKAQAYELHKLTPGKLKFETGPKNHKTVTLFDEQ